MKPQHTCKNGENGRCEESPEGSQSKVVLIPDDQKVIIRDIECRSEEVYSYLEAASAQGDPVDALIRALECGASVLKRVSARIDYEHVEKLAGESFNRLERSITDYVQRNLDPSEQGTLARRIGDVFRVQQDQVKDMLNKGDLHVADFERKMAAFSQSLQTTLQATLANAMSSDGTGISMLLREVKTEVQTLRDAIVSKATEGLTSPPVKGENYEDEIFRLINKWAEAFQNTLANVIVEDVRSVTGSLGKQGDAVVRLIAGAESRICIEMKAQERMSANKIIEVCNAAKVNRNADVVIYVASDVANLPAEFGCWTQLEADIIITATPGFEIALKIAASKLLLQKAQSHNTGIDVERGLSLLQDIDSQLKMFSVLLSCSRATVKNAQKAQQAALDIRDGIEEATEQLVHLLNGNNDEPKTKATPNTTGSGSP
jgi:hypothetical protein